MTVRQSKQFALAAGAIIAAAFALNLYVLVRDGFHDPLSLWPGPFFLLLIVGWWTRLSKLQAEHGPDYVQPTPVRLGRWLPALLVALVALGGVLTYLAIVRR